MNLHEEMPVLFNLITKWDACVSQNERKKQRSWTDRLVHTDRLWHNPMDSNSATPTSAQPYFNVAVSVGLGTDVGLWTHIYFNVDDIHLFF